MYKLTCPTCHKRLEYQRQEDASSRPFCSKRCQMIDLGRWLREDYRVSEPLGPNHLDAAPDESSCDDQGNGQSR